MGEGGWVEFKNLGSTRLHYFLVCHKKASGLDAQSVQWKAFNEGRG